MTVTPDRYLNVGHPCVAGKGAKHSPESHIMRKSTSYNQVPEIFISINIDTELNETTHVMSFKRCQVDVYIRKRIIQNYMSNAPQNCSMLTLMGPNSG